MYIRTNTCNINVYIYTYIQTYIHTYKQTNKQTNVFTYHVNGVKQCLNDTYLSLELMNTYNRIKQLTCILASNNCVQAIHNSLFAVTIDSSSHSTGTCRTQQALNFEVRISYIRCPCYITLHYVTLSIINLVIC